MSPRPAARIRACTPRRWVFGAVEQEGVGAGRPLRGHLPLTVPVVPIGSPGRRLGGRRVPVAGHNARVEWPDRASNDGFPTIGRLPGKAQTRVDIGPVDHVAARDDLTGRVRIQSSRLKSRNPALVPVVTNPDIQGQPGLISQLSETKAPIRFRFSTVVVRQTP